MRERSAGPRDSGQKTRNMIVDEMPELSGVHRTGDVRIKNFEKMSTVLRFLLISSIFLAIIGSIFVLSAPIVPEDPFNHILHDVIPIAEAKNFLPDDHIGLHSVDDVIVKHPI